MVPVLDALAVEQVLDRTRSHKCGVGRRMRQQLTTRTGLAPMRSSGYRGSSLPLPRCQTLSYDPCVRIMWAPEDLAYIGTRSQRYSGALAIAVDGAHEVVADP